MLQLIATLFFSFVLFIGCSSSNSSESKSASVLGDIKDKISWYADMTDDVLVMDLSVPVPNDYLCAPYTNPTGVLRACTLEDVLNDTDSNDAYEPLLHIKMQADDFIPSSEQMNASFEQKGKTTRNADQKSFRVKLDSTDVLYKKERTFQLNKHPYDNSRVRNKLAFDLFRNIPNFTSLKTQFVNLRINGVDYGLYTHIEKMGKEFLINRGWNEDDNLYKAQNFAFRMVNELNLNSSGKPINPDAFDSVIEIERGKDHTKLVAMLNAIDAAQTDAEFEAVFNRYFNRNNYITWMAINLVMANKDTVSQNFYLFNPLNSDTFYFMPWDYDGTGRATEKYAKWELGIATWWGIPLHQKFLKVKKNRDDVDAMVTTLRNQYVTPAAIQARLDVYEPLITPYLSVDPDANDLSTRQWRTEFDILIPRLDENIANYRGEIGVPMPFWQSFEYNGGVLKLMWDEAVDFEGDEIIYDVQCADNVDFNNSIVNETGLSVAAGDLNITSWGEVSYTKTVPMSTGVRYYMKITAREKNNPAHYQIAFDKEVEINDVTYFGLLEFALE
ncbi:MAG: CotH kinase family protein [Sulfurimonas sp.]|nr:CotH kinase family protein [Sulfurimonas sp.]